ncbi:MAG: hypothetical protein ACYC0H_21960, partial [Solirubrobacteraceae bacterium]
LFVAAAAAATIATRSSESPADRLLNQVMRLTHSGSRSGPCALYGRRHAAPLSDETLDPRLAAELPALASAPPSPPGARLVAMVEHNSGGAILARTIREVRLPGGITLVVWVDHGLAGFQTVNPRRCLAARLAKLAELRPDPHNALREAVARAIQRMRDTNDKQQALSLLQLRDGSLQGGDSFPLRPGPRRLPTGVLFSSSACNAAHVCSPTLYGGIAAPDVAYLTVAPAPHAGHRGRRVRRRVAVVEGFFAFTLPLGSGRETVTQRTRNGTPLITTPLHERSPPSERPTPSSTGAEEERPQHR